MNPEDMRCSKCSGEMVQGFIVDCGQGPRRLVSSWAEGAPEKAFLRGTSSADEDRVPIGTFRCSASGYLESYARDEFSAK
jgi:hypothetical protein